MKRAISAAEKANRSICHDADVGLGEGGAGAPPSVVGPEGIALRRRDEGGGPAISPFVEHPRETDRVPGRVRERGTDAALNFHHTTAPRIGTNVQGSPIDRGPCGISRMGEPLSVSEKMTSGTGTSISLGPSRAKPSWLLARPPRDH